MSSLLTWFYDIEFAEAKDFTHYDTDWIKSKLKTIGIDLVTDEQFIETCNAEPSESFAFLTPQHSDIIDGSSISLPQNIVHLVKASFGRETSGPPTVELNFISNFCP